MHIVFLLLVAIIGAWPSQVQINFHKEKEQFVHLTTTAKNDSIRWEVQKGTCYSQQIASIRIEGWRIEQGRPFFPGIVRALRPGHCELWLKSGDGELRIPVFVM